MKFVYSCQTDIGAARSVNQDSLVIKSLNFHGHTVLMAAVCDGVGGLRQGELTSRKAAEMLSMWFDFELPQIIGHSNTRNMMYCRCKQLFADINKEIYYGNLRAGVSSGTTVSMILLWDYQYLIGHVGDSRIYEITGQMRQLTTDHSFLAREVALGHMTLEEAALDSRQNVILKCMGTEADVEPDLLMGTVSEPAVFLLCTDGFWHYMEPKAWAACLSPQMISGEKQLGELLYQMTECVKNKGETDNITVIAIDVC